MNVDDFLKKLKDKDNSLTPEQLKTGLIETMLLYIQKEIELFELIEVGETIRLNYKSRIPVDVKEVVSCLHDLRENQHDESVKQMSEETITFMVDDLLDELVGT